MSTEDLEARSHPRRRGAVWLAIAAATAALITAMVVAREPDHETRIRSATSDKPAPAIPSSTSAATSSTAIATTTIIAVSATTRSTLAAPPLPTTAPAPPRPWRALAPAARVDVSAIYVIEPDGSHLARLVSGPSVVRGASFSPDGTRVAFVVGDRLEVIALDGQSRVTMVAGGVSSNEPRWAPDGQAIAFIARDGEARPARVVDVATGSVQPIADTPPMVRDVDWSPDGQRIVLASESGIHTVARDGATPTMLHESPHPVWQVRWSPRGDRLLYGSNGRVWTYNPQTNTDVELGLDGGTTLFENRWSPDGEEIAVGLGSRLALYQRDGGRETVNAPALSPTWSPDGTWLLVRRLETRGSSAERTLMNLVIMRPDGTDSRTLLADHADDQPSWRDHQWRPQGDLVLFTATTFRPGN